MVNVKVPAAVGLPDRTPVLLLSARPVGMVPEDLLKVYGGVPLLAAIVWLYPARFAVHGVVLRDRIRRGRLGAD